jgi:hypothetical protein
LDQIWCSSEQTASREEEDEGEEEKKKEKEREKKGEGSLKFSSSHAHTDAFHTTGTDWRRHIGCPTSSIAQARKSQLVPTGIIWPWQKKRLEILCREKALDHSFAVSSYCTSEYLRAASDLDREHHLPEEKSKQAIATLRKEFRDIRPFVSRSSFSARIDNSQQNIQRLIEAVRNISSFFAPVPAEKHKPLSGLIFSKQSDASMTRQDFNILVGNHKDKLDFLVGVMTVDLEVHFFGRGCGSWHSKDDMVSGNYLCEIRPWCTAGKRVPIAGLCQTSALLCDCSFKCRLLFEWFSLHACS